MFYLAIVGASILLIGLILSFIVARRQQNHELDKTMSVTTYKHRILANPAFIAYASIIVVGVVLVGYFMISHSK